MSGALNAMGGQGGRYVVLWRQGTQPPFSFQARLLKLLLVKYSTVDLV